MTELIIALLDDEHGISNEAFEALMLVVSKRLTPEIEEILKSVDGCENRVYLPENWREV